MAETPMQGLAEWLRVEAKKIEWHQVNAAKFRRWASEVEAARASPADTRSERERFWAWVEDCGCDTDGAWSAWQARASLPAAVKDSLTARPDDLHAAIMNLPIGTPGWAGNDLLLYKEGHRDARHAAAELVCARPDAALLKDAERYRWLREQYWNDGALCVVATPKVAVKLGHDCPSLERLDAAIDAARQALEKP